MSSKLFVCFAIFALAAVAFAAEPAPANSRAKKHIIASSLIGAYPQSYGYNYGYATPYNYGYATPYSYGYATPYSYGYATPYSYASFNSYPYGHSAYNHGYGYVY